MSFTKKKRGNKYKYSKKRRNNKITKKNKKMRGGVKRNSDNDENNNDKKNIKTDAQDLSLQEDTEIQTKITETLIALPNRQNRCITLENAQFCVNGPDFQINENYRALLNYFQNNSEMAEINKTKISFLIEGMNERAGLIRTEEGQYSFTYLPIKTDASFPFGQLLKFVVVQDKNGMYTLVYGNARMPNVNYAEEFFLKWTDKINNVWSIRDFPKKVVYITDEIIQDIEKFARRNSLRLEWDQLLATKSLNQPMYEDIMQAYFNETNGQRNYSDPDTGFMLSSYEVSHSALANGLTNIGMSNEARQRALIYAGCEGVFWRNKSGKICFVIANRSGHYQTPKEYLEYIIPIMQALRYRKTVLIKNPEPKSDLTRSYSSSSSSSDSEDDSKYIWYISNCLNKNDYVAARDKLEFAVTTPVLNGNYIIKAISMTTPAAAAIMPPQPPPGTATKRIKR